MTSIRSRLLAALLAAVLALGAPLTALADELSLAPADPGGEAGSSAGLLDITVPDYTPDRKAGDVDRIQKGELYTLIVLPQSVAANGSTPKPLDATLLTTADPLFIGSAIASDNGKVTFTNIRLRTSQAAVYYVTGPGLTTPLAETTGLSVSLSGNITYTPLNETRGVENATVSLVDETTDYSYANSVPTGSAGFFTLDDLSPGRYFLHVEKPGFLPATRETVTIVNDNNTKLVNFDLSPYLGDVNGDGKRTISDLTDLLFCYGKSPSEIPDGFTPNLYDVDNTVVDISDVAPLLRTMITYDKFPLGTGTPSSDEVSLSAWDVATVGTPRTLRFSLENSGNISGLTFTAASFSLTFRTDYVQPVNQSGGVIHPGSAGASTGCLVPKTGVTVSDARWSVNGDLATLTFSLSCAKPTVLTDLVDFLYAPAPGKNAADFFPGVFAMDHAAALVGQATVLTDCALEYQNSDPLELTAITVDPLPDSVTIPSAGHTLVLPLSATGKKGEEVTYPNLSGLTWTLSLEGGGSVDGVSVSDSLLTVTDQAVPGNILLTASRDGVSSPAVTLTLKAADPVPQGIRILRNGDGVGDHTLTAEAYAPHSFSYAAEVTDQYGAPIGGQPVAWSLSGAPAQISVDESGTLSVDQTLPAGTYSFSLLAGLGDVLRTAVNITLTLEAQPDSLVLSGPSSAQVPSGSDTLVLSYVLSALDAQGRVIPSPALDPTFSIVSDGASPAGINAESTLNGELTVTVSPDAQPGSYTLRAAGEGLFIDFVLTLLPPAEQTAPPVRAAISYLGALTDAPELLCIHGGDGSGSPKFYPSLLDQDGNHVKTETSWKWTVTGLPKDESISYDIAVDHLELATDSAASGTYFFTVTAEDTVSHLAVSVPVHLTVFPHVTGIELQAPETLSIPVSGTLRYPIRATYLDGADPNSDVLAVTPPGPVHWSVRSADDPDSSTGHYTSPKGVSIKDGVLSVTSAATPGEIIVHVQCETPLEYEGSLAMATRTLKLTLVSAGEDKVLSLLRDGELFSGGVDAIYGKEGATLSLSYTPVLRDPLTGEIEELPEDAVSWVGLSGVFTVDSKAEPGVYTAPITALYGGQSVSLTAQITVYPQITGLFIRFDEGDADALDEGYSFPIPSQAARTYRGDLMAKIIRNGKTQKVPLAQLGLTDYDLDLSTPLTGVYLSYDKTTGRAALTVEPLANSNPPGETDDLTLYCLYIDFGYYPEEGVVEYDPQHLRLTKETSVATNAVLRQGSGAGSKFVFETTRGEMSITAAAGVLSNCFAIELLDQYGNPVLNQAVVWELTGDIPTNSSGGKLISYIDPGQAVRSAYPRYQSIRRLRIAQETAPGTYSLTLTAKVAATEALAKTDPVFTRSVAILLTVSQQQLLHSVSVTGPVSAVIPKYYSQYNSSAVNPDKRVLSYVAVACDPHGNETDPALYDFSWKVTAHDGASVSGVTVVSDKDNPAAATVTVDRHARPTPSTQDSDGNPIKQPLRIIATATPKNGSAPLTADTGLVLTQGNLVPTLMTINGSTSIKLDLDSPTTTKTYTFDLVNQYNDPVSQRDARDVDWTWDAKKLPTYVTIDKKTDANGHRYVTLKVTNPKKDVRATVTLTASITFPEASTSSGEARVYKNLPITITVGNPPTGGDGGGGGEAEVTQSTVTPSTSKSGTTGTSTLSQADVDVLTKTTATGTLTIAPKNTTGLTSITVTFPASVAKAIVAKTQNQSLRIQTAIGTVTIPKTTLSDFSGSGNVSVTILNQNNKVAVTFRRGSSTLSSFTSGRTATLSAPVKAQSVTAVSGGVSSSVVGKSVISNGTLTVTLTGSAELTLSGEAEVTQSTVTPSTSKSGTTGTSTLSQADIDLLTKTTAAGTLTIAPTNTSGLTSITVTFPASVAKAIVAKTQNQSLRIQTAIGTVTIPKTTLSDFSGSGNVSVTILNQNDKVAVTFRRGGSDLTSFTSGRTATLSAPVKAQSVTAVSGGVSSDVLQKSVITNGTLTVSLTGSAQLTLGVRGKVFSDTANHWARDAVSFVVERGLFQGTSETTFSPNGDMTRGMVVTVLHRLENTPSPSAANLFSDVPSGTWYTDAVIWANSAGIVQGSGSGFLPNDPVTREQLATILYRYMKTQGRSTDKRDQLAAFSDRDKVSPWAQEAMEWAVATGLITGKGGGVLDPGGKATRAEVATMLERLIRSLTPSV